MPRRRRRGGLRVEDVGCSGGTGVVAVAAATAIGS